MLKRIFCTILLISMCFVMCGCGEKKEKDTLSKILKRGKIVIGVRTDAKPFGFLDDNGINKGFDIDLGAQLAKYILNKEIDAVEYVPVNAQNRIETLNSGKVDMLIATMSITDNRATILDFSAPYYRSGQALLVPNDSEITVLTELNGKHVIVVYGSTSEINVRRALPDAIITGYKTYDEAVNALKKGTADAIIADDTLLLGYTYKDKSLKLLPGRYSVEPYAVAFRKGAESEKIREYTNFFLQDYARTGKLSKLQQTWGI